MEIYFIRMKNNFIFNLKLYLFKKNFNYYLYYYHPQCYYYH